MHDLTYRPAALADLDVIFSTIEADDPRRAAPIVDDIADAVAGLVLYDHDRILPFGDRLRAVPLSCLWA
jgi:plasmid stabilization system protein ParE